MSDIYPDDQSVTNANVTLMISVQGATTVQEVLNIAAASLCRGGLDATNVLIRDADDPDRSWWANGGDVITEQEADRRFRDWFAREAEAQRAERERWLDD